MGLAFVTADFIETGKSIIDHSIFGDYSLHALKQATRLSYEGRPWINYPYLRRVTTLTYTPTEATTHHYWVLFIAYQLSINLS